MQGLVIGDEPNTWGNGGNPSLKDISALANVSTLNTVLRILYNDSLASCEIQSICDYLVIPNGDIWIENNAPGCNSPEEVEEACSESVDEASIINNLSIHPNPFSNSITLEFELSQPESITLTFYNHLGEQIIVITKSKSLGPQKIIWDAEGMPAGIYFCTLKTSKVIQTIKMIKL